MEEALEICDDRYSCYLPPGLQDNRACVLALVERFGTRLDFASERLKADPDSVRAAVQNDAAAVRFTQNREAVLAAVTNQGQALCCADEKFKSDREIVLATVSKKGDALECG